LAADILSALHTGRKNEKACRGRSGRLSNNRTAAGRRSAVVLPGAPWEERGRLEHEALREEVHRFVDANLL